MKAAVLYQLGTAPQYGDFPDPAPQNDNEVVITVRASSIKNLDKGRASGAHYSGHTHLPTVTGIDGVGILADGTRVYAMGITGMMAEKALIDKHKYVQIPHGIDDINAAVLPNVVIGAGLALQYRAKMEAGQTVLINGATGVTGKMAVQLARHYGARRVIATGRNPEILKMLPALGADEVISLKDDDANIINRLKEIHAETPINVVIDYTWGHPAELILTALKGRGLSAISTGVRFVTVGGMAGDNIQLSSAILRSSPIEILGSGFGSLPQAAIDKMGVAILPEMMQLMAEGKLQLDAEAVPLSDIESAWKRGDTAGKRLVVVV
jgi:NADPH:quinone reductase-like Zn-dependent oxidoreductase